MHTPTPLVSLADLSAAGIRLRPYEAVTIVRELLLHVGRGEIAGVPSAHVIRLSGNGQITIEGPVAAGGPSVARAAQLLDALLPTATNGSHFRVPGGLRLVVARGLGTLDFPPFDSLETFTEALSRFASTDPVATVKNLVTAWADYVGSRGPDVGTPDVAPVAAQVEPFLAPRGLGVRPLTELTISDIRRARRATGLTLAQVARQSGVPVPLLRQLEWGYLVNWPTGRRARALLVRYAAAAGLDKEIVCATVEPLLRDAQSIQSAMVRATVPTEPVTGGPPAVVPVDNEPSASPPVTNMAGVARSRWSNALAALAIPALLVIALLPAWWASSSRRLEDTKSPSTAMAGDSTRSSDLRVPEAAASRTSTEDTTGGTAEATGPAMPSAEADHEQAGGVELGGRAVPPTTPDELTRPAADGLGDLTVTPVGTALFYSGEDAGGTGVMTASDRRREAVLQITSIVDDGARNLHLRVAPDGRQIAFDSDRDGVRGVYVADGDGGNVRRVSGEGFAAFPSWSPDGRMLAFVRAEPANAAVWNVWTMDLTTGELKQVSRHRSGQPHGVSWFPDGRRVAYSWGDRVIVRELRTGAERVFASPRRNRPVRGVAVSPDGRRIIFHVERDGGWLLELGDTSMRRVLEDVTAQEYTWSPDGRRVAYHSARAGGWNVWVMAPR